MKRDSNKKQISKWVLGLGILLTFILPTILFFIDIGPADLGYASNIGDAIGGITSPVASLVGSILLYIALTDQIEANNLLSDQIEDSKKEGKVQRNIEHISELYHLFEKSIETFPFEIWQIEEGKKTKQRTLYSGTIAITHFVDFLLVSNDDPHNAINHSASSGIKEFRSIIKSAELLIDRIIHSDISIEDKSFYKNLILHRISYNLSPDFERIPETKRQPIHCELCGKNHGNFPVVLFGAIENLKNQINTLDLNIQEES